MGWPTDADIERERIAKAEREIREMDATPDRWTQEEKDEDRIAELEAALRHAVKIEDALRDALSSFKCTQDPEIYPADHWSRRAIQLLRNSR